jgi:hypothetical protein
LFVLLTQALFVLFLNSNVLIFCFRAVDMSADRLRLLDGTNIRADPRIDTPQERRPDATALHGARVCRRSMFEMD